MRESVVMAMAQAERASSWWSRAATASIASWAVPPAASASVLRDRGYVGVLEDPEGHQRSDAGRNNNFRAPPEGQPRHNNYSASHNNIFGGEVVVGAGQLAARARARH